VEYTPNRENVWVTQTPQAFRRELLEMAHENAAKQKITATDDAFLVELLGYKVKMVEGYYENIKVTTPEDLVTAEAILKTMYR
jgi:2-C-methyl-D-erythritol 4-phosphate cytidylyltransferase